MAGLYSSGQFHKISFLKDSENNGSSTAVSQLRIQLCFWNKITTSFHLFCWYTFKVEHIVVLKAKYGHHLLTNLVGSESSYLLFDD